VVDDDGQEYPQNPIQRYLWECWLAVQELPGPDVVILLGDLIDGPQYRPPGGAVTRSLDLQQRALIEVLGPVVRGRVWYCIAGTSYHEPDRLGLVAQLLGAQRGALGEWVLDELYLPVSRWLLEARHHPDGHGALYRGTTMDRESMLTVLLAAKGKAHPSDVIVTAHRHQYALFQAMGLTVVAAPGWQAQTRYAKQRGPKRWVPDIGCVDIEFDEDLGIPIVRPVLFTPPLPPVLRLPQEVTDAQAATAERGGAAQRPAASRSRRKR
jgi:hypothetical protein